MQRPNNSNKRSSAVGGRSNDHSSGYFNNNHTFTIDDNSPTRANNAFYNLNSDGINSFGVYTVSTNRNSSTNRNNNTNTISGNSNNRNPPNSNNMNRPSRSTNNNAAAAPINRIKSPVVSSKNRIQVPPPAASPIRPRMPLAPAATSAATSQAIRGAPRSLSPRASRAPTPPPPSMVPKDGKAIPGNLVTYRNPQRRKPPTSSTPHRNLVVNVPPSANPQANTSAANSFSIPSQSSPVGHKPTVILTPRPVRPIATFKIPYSQVSTSATSQQPVKPHTTIGRLIGVDRPPVPDKATAARTALWNRYKNVLLEAYSQRKIFLLLGYFPTLRQELLNRGWLEKLGLGRFHKIENLDDETLTNHIKPGNDYEAVALARLLQPYPAFFIWQDRGSKDAFAEQKPYRNIIRREASLDFSTKIGLMGCADLQKWYVRDGVSGMNYPRFYRLAQTKEDDDAFTRDYLLTQCASLARYVKSKINEPYRLYDYEKGTVPISIFSFAVGQLKKHCVEMQNDFNLSTEDVTNMQTQPEWKHFLFYSNEVLHGNGKFKGAFRDLLNVSKSSEEFLKILHLKYPDRKYDGHKNLWILKPGFQCRGTGIVVRYNLEHIFTMAKNNVNARYIAQKYIERPMLIYNVKFDIRQYMLVTIGEKLIRIWLYKDCYLKLSGQEFNLDDLNESIHLTNNTVQRRYKISRNRDSRLPASNMWSLEQFKTYLNATGMGDTTWESKVFPGFKRNLIAVVMASMEETNMVPNSFELYGCDFMLDESQNPILIEINSSPDMSASTEITARLCPQVLRDVVKVIVDLPIKPYASTGLFELIFEQNYKGYATDSKLTVSGHAMNIETYKNFKQTATNQKKAAKKNASPSLIKPTIEDQKKGSNTKNN